MKESFSLQGIIKRLGICIHNQAKIVIMLSFMGNTEVGVSLKTHAYKQTTVFDFTLS